MRDNRLGLRYWTGQRVTRRRVLGGAVAGGAAVAAIGLVGCSSGSKSGNGGSATAVATGTVQDGYQDGPGQPGGILRVRGLAVPTMNPFGPGIFALAQGLVLGYTVFDHMWFVPTDTGDVELFLATELEQPDDLTVIASLGEATFHEKGPAPGRAIDAEDVVQSYKRFREEAPIGYSWLHDVMDDIVATDDRTVKITNRFTWAWVFTSSNAGSPITSSIMPKEILRGYDDLLRTDAIGSGHWTLAGHDNGTNEKFRKFANFRNFQNGRNITGQPFLNGVDFKEITDDNAALAAFRAGEIDTHGFTSRNQMDATIAALGDRIVTGSDLSRDYLNLMLHYEPPFTDERVRKAINLLIDREEAILLLNDGDAVKCGPMPPAHKRYVLPDDDPDLQEYFRTDVQEARQLLEAAEFDFNSELELKHSNRPVDSQLAQVLKEQLGRGGVQVKLVQEDLIKWFSQTLNQHQFQMTCFQHLPYEDPDLPLRFYLSAEGDRPSNFMDYQDADVDAAILSAAKELDEEARVEKVREAQRVVMKKYAPMLNVLSAVNFGGRYSYVKGSIVGRGSYGGFNRTTWLDDAGRRQEG
ncbi:MAG: ABC transporter substrate-binding protein [Dehalococcoidia bacterium]